MELVTTRMNIKRNIIKRSIFITQRFLVIFLFSWRKFTFVALFLSNYFEAFLNAEIGRARTNTRSIPKIYFHDQISLFSFCIQKRSSSYLNFTHMNEFELASKERERVWTTNNRLVQSLLAAILSTFLFPNVAPAFFPISRLAKF